MNEIARLRKASQPEEIFARADEDVVKKTFTELAKLCHPDHFDANDAATIFDKLVKLRDLALRKIRDGIWEVPGLLSLKAVGGRTLEIRYRKQDRFDLGSVYIGKGIIGYVADVDKTDLMDRMLVTSSKMPKYASSKMKAQYSRYVPNIISSATLTDGRLMIVIKKPIDVYRLTDVVRTSALGSDPRHAAWVISRLMDISGWLDYCDIAHYGLTPDNLWVDPANHAIHPYGGWWYAHHCGSKLVAVPKIVMSDVGKSCTTDKIATKRINQSLAKLVGRYVLGDVTGSRLRMNKDIPRVLADWLNRISSESVVQEIDLWRNVVLPEAFGPRKFIVLDVDEDKVYG